MSGRRKNESSDASDKRRSHKINTNETNLEITGMLKAVNL
jgi:hypothetical protein